MKDVIIATLVVLVVILMGVIFWTVEGPMKARPPFTESRFVTSPEPVYVPVYAEPPPPQVIRVVIDNNETKPPVSYSQIGFLTNMDTKEILSLYGQPTHARRGRWHYYTIVQGVKLSITYGKRDCLDEVSCEEIFDDEEVMIPDYTHEQQWRVKIYKKYY